MLLETIVLLLKFGCSVDKWPSFRDEEFDDLIVHCARYIFRCNLKDIDLRKVGNDVCQSFSWNIKNSKSIGLKMELCNALCVICSQCPDLLHKISLLIPMLDMSPLQSEIVQSFRTFLSLYYRSSKTIKRSTFGEIIEVDSDEEDKESPTKRRKLLNGELKDNNQQIHHPILNPKVKQLEEFYGASFQFEKVSNASIKVFELLMEKIKETENSIVNFTCLDTLLRIFIAFPDTKTMKLLFDILKNWIKNVYLQNTEKNFDTAETVIALMREIHKLLSFDILEIDLINLFLSFVSSIIETKSPQFQLIREESLEILCFFPKTYDISSLVNILTNTLHDSDEGIKIKAITILSKFIEKFGTKIANDLIPILKSISTYKSDKVLEALGLSIGEIITIIYSKDQQKSFNLDEWKIFFNLLSNEYSLSVKLAFIQSIPHILSKCKKDDLLQCKELLLKCLSLIGDSDGNIRRSFALVSDSFVQEVEDITPLEIAFGSLSHFEQQFTEWTEKAKKQNDNEMIQTLLLTLGRMGIAANGNLLKFILFSLLQYLIEEDVTLRAIAYDQIRYISNVKNVAIDILYMEFKEELYPKLIDFLTKSPKLLDEVVFAIFDKETIEFLQESLGYTLPRLILTQSTTVLEKLAEKIDQPLSSMVIDYLEVILVFLLLNNLEYAEIYNTIKYIADVILKKSIPIGELLSSSIENVITQLVWAEGDLSKEKRDQAERAFTLFSQLCSECIPGKPKKNAYMKENMIKFKCIYIINFLNDIITGKHPLEDKLQALRSVDHILHVFKQDVNLFIASMMTTLKQALDIDELRTYALDVWFSFVKALGMEGAHLISQIIVNLLPYINSDTEKVVKIFEFMIIENTYTYNQYFKDIPFLPSIKPLEKINNTIVNEIGGEGKFDRMLSGMDHESSSVRKTALKQMLEFLKQYPEEIQNWIIGNEYTHRSIDSIVSKLLIGCNESDFEERLLCMECLGTLGAIDPTRLNINVKADDRSEMQDIDLAITIITDFLCKSLKSTEDPKIQRRKEYAIQELLQFCREEAEDHSSLRLQTNMTSTISNLGSWWDDLPDSIKHIIQPYLFSKWMLKVKEPSQISLPVFRPDKPFNEWLYDFSKVLISKSRGRQAKIFKVLRGVMKDPVIASFILPYLVANVIKHGNLDDINGIKKELLLILTNNNTGSEHSQTVITLITLLNNWVEAHKKRVQENEDNLFGTDEQYEKIEKLLSEIPLDILAKSSYNNKAYSRALMYYENYLREIRNNEEVKNPFTPEQINFLQKVYSCLDDRDGLAGIATLRTYTSFQAEIIDYENSGNWSAALNCCEIALQNDPQNLFYHLKILKCLKNLGHLQTMFRNIDGTLPRIKEGRHKLRNYGVQAAWRLGQWDEVKKYLDGSKDSFEVGIAKALLAYKNKQEKEFIQIINKTREDLMGPLSAACMESYHRAYPFIVKLQMLNELEQSTELWDLPHQSIMRKNFVKNLNTRLEFTKNSLDTREPLLSLRRAIFSIHNMHTQVGICWLKWAKMAREAGHYQTASSAILKAKNYKIHQAYIEEAKLLNQQGQIDESIKLLESYVRDLNKILETNKDEKLEHLRVKSLLLIVNWNQLTRRKLPHEVQEDYKKIISYDHYFEDGYYNLAKYMDSLLQSLIQKNSEILMQRKAELLKKTSSDEELLKISRKELEPYKSYLKEVLRNYHFALVNGHKFIYESLPRMLTLWFDFGEYIQEEFYDKRKKLPSELKPEIEDLENKVNETIRKSLNELPYYYWLTVISQLVSRVCHKNEKTLKLLKEIIVNILIMAPQYSLWSVSVYFQIWLIIPKKVLAVIKSNESKRVKNASEIIYQAKKSSNAKKIFTEANLFFDSMIALCNFKPERRTRSLELNSLQFLQKLLSKGPLSILLPIQQSLTIVLPQNGKKLESNFSPFPKNLITITQFDRKITVMQSAQKPKKICIVGSDGKSYFFLCKPQDDLRKDARMMEFTGVINRLLKINKESRRRKLYIRRFSVIPLNDDCGLIEWVNNTEIFRGICAKQYSLYSTRKDKNKLCEVVSTIKKDLIFAKGFSVIERLYKTTAKRDYLDMFENQILPIYPPLFYKWFLTKFPEPAKWFQNRLNYARTSAVWSMVGYVVGLGDRHGENILFDQNNGDCVHVDFSCLFERGKLLQVPECVPFRLTQNMVDAFGICGYEGVFRKVCEVTMSVLRDHKDMLMNVLETFIHDPLVEWNIERSNPRSEGEKKMKVIEQKLQGLEVDSGSVVPLSVQGQVHQLIREATSNENLCKMWRWWMPWL